MARLTISQRVTALERQVKSLLDRLDGERTKDWRRTVGAFAGEEFMREVFAEGRKIRAAERAQARSARRKRRTRS